MGRVGHGSPKEGWSHTSPSEDNLGTVRAQDSPIPSKWPRTQGVTGLGFQMLRTEATWFECPKGGAWSSQAFMTSSQENLLS